MYDSLPALWSPWACDRVNNCIDCSPVSALLTRGDSSIITTPSVNHYKCVDSSAHRDFIQSNAHTMYRNHVTPSEGCLALGGVKLPLVMWWQHVYVYPVSRAISYYSVSYYKGKLHCYIRTSICMHERCTHSIFTRSGVPLTALQLRQRIKVP